MNVSILTVGDELTSGELEDNNAPWIARLALQRGHRVLGFQTVGDEVDSVAAAIRHAKQSCELLIVTGGLGPTADDLTRDGVAAALGLKLETRPEILAGLKNKNPGSARQAEIPIGAQLLENPRGTAPGFLATVEGFQIACVPGVPSEMRAMVRLLFDRFVPSREGPPTMKFVVCGCPESELGDRLNDLMDMTRTDARLGITTKQGLHTVAVRGVDGKAVEQLFRKARERVDPALIVGDGDVSLAQMVVEKLKAAGKTLATAESCTGGLLSSAITSVSGSSAVFLEGAVTYANRAKTERLDVPAALIEKHGAVSEPVARAMAEGCRARAKSDYALSITGVAGPGGGTPAKPVGTVVLAIADGKETRTLSTLWKGSREEIRLRAVNTALDLLRRALPMLLLAAVACSEKETTPPNVVIWLVDTLRADHLGCYGYGRPTSPVIDELAENGTRFADMHAHSNWTQPSVQSILSARYPLAYDAAFTSKVPDAMTMAAEWFGQHGYRTGGFTVTMAVGGRFGFHQGYDDYEELELLLDENRREKRTGAEFDADRLVDAALPWLDRPGRPFFLYLHSVDPHLPVGTHEGTPSFAGAYDGPVDGSAVGMGERQRAGYVFSPEDRQHLVDLYDNEVRFNDGQLGRLLAELEARGLRENTLIVVLSDHGEELFDHGAHGHGSLNLHRELTHIPLLLNGPGVPEGETVEGLARAVDILPTVLELAGLPPLPEADGESMLPQMRGEERKTAVFLDRAKSEKDGLIDGVRTEGYLYVEDPTGGRTGLYDLRADEGEMVDMRERDADTARRLAGILEVWRSVRPDATLTGERAAGEVDEEELAALRELGYLR